MVNLAADGLQVSNWAAICGFWRRTSAAHAAPQSNLELAPGFTAVQKQLEQRSRSLRKTYT